MLSWLRVSLFSATVRNRNLTPFALPANSPSSRPAVPSQFVRFLSCGQKTIRLRNHFLVSNSCLAIDMCCTISMFGLAREFDLYLDWLLRLGLRVQSLPRRHHLLNGFRESERLGKTGLPHADLRGSGRETASIIPMCGLRGELYSGVIPRQKSSTEFEMTAKSKIRLPPFAHD